MKAKNSLRIGDILELEISGHTHKGWGIGRFLGQVIFVPGAICGESARVRINAIKKGIPIGEIIELNQKAAARVVPDCPENAVCGGCALRHMDYAAQLKLKQNIVKDQLKRIGGLLSAVDMVENTVGMENPKYYRNKGVFHADYREGKLHLGFVAEGTHQVAARCELLFRPELRELMAKTEELLLAYPELCRNLRSCLARQSFDTGELMLIASQKQPSPPQQWQRFFAELKLAIPKLKVFGTALDQGRGQELANLALISSDQTLTERLNGVSYQISPASFFQVNPEQTAKMLKRLCALAGTAETVIDAYGGIGTIGLQLAAVGLSVTGIEIVPAAVRDYNENAKTNGLFSARCLLGRAEKLFDQAAAGISKRTLVVVDPPRKGCAPDFLRALIDFAPFRIAYLSCDPATLARDLKQLAAGGYQPDFIEPYDFFPHSYHIETLVMLSKKC